MSPQAKPLVGILMGSDTDLAVMSHAAKVLKDFGVPFEIDITSAHRSPQRTSEYARSAALRGIKVIIVGAGAAAALAGAVASETTLPVIGVPMATSPLSGFDALLSTAMMPAGVPVATMAVGDAGARNAAVLAMQIIALSDSALSTRLLEYKQELERSVREKSEKVKAQWHG